MSLNKQVKEAMETISGFDMDGFLSGLNMSKRDHEGGGKVKVYQVRDGKWVQASDWFSGYRGIISKMVWDN